MTKIYTRPKQYSLSRVGLEIYETDEENFEPYISSGLVSATKSTTSKSTTTSEDSEDTEAADTTVEEDTEEDDKGFKLHQGEIKTKFYMLIILHQLPMSKTIKKWPIMVH